MLFSNQRDEIRQFYFTIWQRGQMQLQLDPLEQQIYTVMLEHPEYHEMLNKPEKFVDKDYLPEFGETNPFLHMGLHLGIREQVATNRPAGMTELYQQLVIHFKGEHLVAEHEIMEVLAEQIWQCQKNGVELDDVDYFAKLTELKNKLLHK